MIDGTLQEKLEWALDMFESKGWREVVLPELLSDYNVLKNDLEATYNDREKDLIIKGQLVVLNTILSLKDKYKKMLENTIKN